MSQAKEITWNIINALLAGGLVFLGACTTGTIDRTTIITAMIAAGVIILTKFQSYWTLEQSEYKAKVFDFIKF